MKFFTKKLSMFQNLDLPLFFCKIGLHLPLKGHTYNFTDKISGKHVYDTQCPCGKKWMTDSKFSLVVFKVEKK